MKVIFIDGTKAFSPHRLREKASGGIVTSLTLIPRYLAKRGLDVTVLSIYDRDEHVDGVHYVHQIPEHEKFDVAVFNRNMLNRRLMEHFKGAVKVWWLHDIVDYRYLEDDGYKAVDSIVALSQYCVDSYADFYGIGLDKFTFIPNGVDPSVFYTGSWTRNRNLFLCASAPIKGLYPIWFTLQNMRRVNPDVELRIYASQSLHDLEDDKRTRATLGELEATGAKVLEPIPQHELADVMRQARGLLMPNHYPEICSNLLLQARACGLPVVGVPIGSCREFLADGVEGLLTKTAPHDMYWWWRDFAAQAVRLMTEDSLFDTISEATPMGVHTWDEIGEQWYDLLTKGSIK